MCDYGLHVAVTWWGEQVAKEMAILVNEKGGVILQVTQFVCLASHSARAPASHSMVRFASHSTRATAIIPPFASVLATYFLYSFSKRRNARFFAEFRFPYVVIFLSCVDSSGSS